MTGIGELYGLSRSLTLPVTAAALLIVVATKSYRRVERIAIVIGLFELAFFAVAWAAHPNLETLAKNVVDLPLYNREFMFLGGHRSGLQSMDDLLSTGRHCRQKTAARWPPAAPRRT